MDPDEVERALADRNINFARARSLLDQGRTLAALDQTGRFLTDLQPTRDYAFAVAR